MSLFSAIFVLIRTQAEIDATGRDRFRLLVLNQFIRFYNLLQIIEGNIVGCILFIPIESVSVKSTTSKNYSRTHAEEGQSLKIDILWR